MTSQVLGLNVNSNLMQRSQISVPAEQPRLQHAAVAGAEYELIVRSFTEPLNTINIIH